MTQPVSTLLILGASGDLTSRLLLPALGQLLTQQPDRQLQLVGAGDKEMTIDEWRAVVATSFSTTDASGPAVEALLSSTVYIQADVTQPAALERLLGECAGAPAIYFALPPAVAALVCDSLGSVTIPVGTQLALEKPFGTNEQSAARLNAQLTTLVPEDQVHRVDHFLGRSTVFNLLGVRFANRMFEPVWNGENIHSVDIIYDEQLGLEGRAGYYDRAGAMVDMIQSHLLQVMSIIAMDPPATLDARDLRDAKGLVLRATRVRGNDPAASTRRGRYTAGTVDGRPLPSYVDAQGVNPANNTETLAEVTFEVDTWRWAGVPFTLRSGKALSARRREVVITFKEVPHVPGGLRGSAAGSVLRMFLAPDELVLELNINGPGDPQDLERVHLKAQFGPGKLSAYGEVLEGLLDGDPWLSVRGDTAEQCWRIIEPVLDAWRGNAVPLEDYPAGSTGPSGWAPLG
jgi:glucose-6-phosphate 1-dehydrogenase